MKRQSWWCLCAAVVSLVVAAEGDSCGSCGQGCPNCEYVDFGSCGNACCKLDAVVPSTTTEAVMTLLNATLTAGGFDGRYRAEPTAEGSPGCADLRFALMPVDYICKFIHTTVGGYDDSITLTVAPTPDGVTLRLFSLSLIGGAYGDSGQNFLNLFMVLDALKGVATFSHVDRSCPNPITSLVNSSSSFRHYTS